MSKENDRKTKIEQENIYIDYGILMGGSIFGYMCLILKGLFGHIQWYHYIIGLFFASIFWYSVHKILNARKM